MGYDTEYNASTTMGNGPDNTIDATNNYTQITGARSKVGRCVVAEWKEVDGEGIGNRAWALLAREQDTPTNRQLLAFHTENAVKWLVDNGEIRDLEVIVDDVAYSDAMGLLVRFFDVREGDTATLGFIAPWGKK